MSPRIAFGVVCCALFRCSELKPEPTDAGATEPVVHVDNQDGTRTTTFDATSDATWRYFDLETKKEAHPATPESSTEWDLGFLRFRFKINGGISGSGGMELARLSDGDFAALTRAPPPPYLTDEADSDDVGSIEDYAFNREGEGETGPFNYDPDTHELSGSTTVYVVKSVEGNWFKVQVKKYENAAGSPGFPQIVWAPVDPPDGTPQGLVVPAAMTRYFSVESGVVTVPVPATSVDWDFAVNQAGWSTNSGPDRVGVAGARLAPPGATYEEIIESPTTGFVIDQLIVFPGPPGSPRFIGNSVLSDWFDYDSIAHLATSKGLVYLVRTAGGEYGKLKIEDYDNAAFSYRLSLDSVERKVVTEISTLDGTNLSTWTYFSFRLNQSMEVSAPLDDAGWDIAISGPRMRTNGGTSGSGLGGALVAAASALPDVRQALESGYQSDALLPDPFGAGQYSGNPVLADWYNYDVATGTTAKDVAYLLRTPDGSYVKLKVRGYAAGQYTLHWAFAGPNRNDF